MSKKTYYDTVLAMPRAEMSKDPRFKDRTGQVFGRLTVLHFSGRTQWGQAQWSCECACGNLTVVPGNDLVSGHTTSCGCQKRELASQRATTHGMRHSSLYELWVGIKTRTSNQNYYNYARYGGRGITCTFGSFEEFYTHISVELGDRPTQKHSLDRIDNNGPYGPGNLRWATKAEQARNTKRNILVTWEGREVTLVEACELAGKPYYTTYSRLAKLGWTPEEALHTPIGQKRAQPPTEQPAGANP